jgi:hypothetical protein
METDNLIPWDKRTPLERVAMGRIGGKSKSVRKSEGAKLRHIKDRMAKQGLTDADTKWLLECLNDRKSYAAMLAIHAQEIRKDVHPAQRVALLNTEAKIGEFTHGQKIQQETLNMNVNVSLEEWERRLMESKKRRGD